MSGGDLVLDSGALSMFAEGDVRLLAVLEAAQRQGAVLLVPTVCLVESLTGTARDARLHQRLRATRSVVLDESVARDAARRRAAVGGDDAADPVVAATAAAAGASVVTTDPDDLGRLARAVRPWVGVMDPRA